MGISLDRVRPRVSVVMSAYNAEKFLREAIDSILAQTFTDFEFIIVDDGSTDRTSQILNSYSDPRIIRNRNERNLGYTPSLNWGVAHARSELIARMDADDISLPDRLALQVDFLERHPSIAVLGTGFQKMDQTGKLTSGEILLPDNPRFIQWLLAFQNTLCHPTVMFRRSIFLKSGGYDPAFMPAEDYDLWQRLSLEEMISNIQKSLLLYRKHDQNISKTQGLLQTELDLRISQRALGSLTGLSVSVDDIKGVRKLSDQNPQRYLDLIMISQQQFICKNQVTDKEKKMIRQDAASRLFAIANRRWRDRLSRKWLFKACWMNPSLMKSLFNSFKQRMKVNAVG
jgi:glycosyltransferase involved in cell wall biosynthesis